LRLLSDDVPPSPCQIAYASQRAFIFTGTLRENILLDQPYDAARFAKVIEACGLQRDIGRLPKGEHTKSVPDHHLLADLSLT
jgi:ABC-type transport system involved in cytochrome bd biosynthesis fused ATPase/permease subunit